MRDFDFATLFDRRTGPALKLRCMALGQDRMTLFEGGGADMDVAVARHLSGPSSAWALPFTPI